MNLVDRWPLAGAEDVRDALLAAYADPRRGYHDTQHLREVLDRLDELEAAGERFDRSPCGWRPGSTTACTTDGPAPRSARRSGPRPPWPAPA